MIYDITIVLIYFWKLCWHLKGRSIWKILSNPKGGPGWYETKIKTDDTKFHIQTQYNFTNKQHIWQRRNKGQHNELNNKKSLFVLLQTSQVLDTNVPYDGGFGYLCCNHRFRYRARSEFKEMKRRRKGQSKGRNIEVEPIKGYRSNLYMHEYPQIDPASINKTRGNASAESNVSIEILDHAMALTLYFVSTFHSVMDTILPKPPNKPPDGLITAVITIPMNWIWISYQSIIACVHIMKPKPKTKHKRHHKRSE